MKYFIIGSLLLLTACQSSEEKKAAYMNFCTTHDFTFKQCEVLYLNKVASDDASDSASASMMMSGAAMGMSGGRR